MTEEIVIRPGVKYDLAELIKRAANKNVNVRIAEEAR